MRRAMVCGLLSLAACGGGDTSSSPNGSLAIPIAGAVAPPVTSVVPPSNQQGASGAASTPASASQGTPTPQAAASAQGGAPAMTPGTPVTTTPPAMAATTPVPQGIAPPDGFKANAMNECGLHTKWKGDEFCILPPPADKGFQMHLGPTNYDNPEATWILQPGQENVHTYAATSANDKDIYFYVRQYRMRPGAHHTIVRDLKTGRRLSGSDVNQDHPVGGITAPENAGIGIPLAAHSSLSTDHHAINTTQQALLQEIWVNFWYVDPTKVTEATNLLYDPGSVSATVAPHADVVLGPYTCDIKTPGRLISMFGHVHASNVRFSAWRTRGAQKDLIYESYHWEDPLWLEFTSLAKNNAPDPTQQFDGGWTGMLALQAGDTITWECHEVNQQDSTLTFTNQTYKGEMCIIIGDLVETKCVSRSGVFIDPSAE
jgi:hypothetical protein